MTSRSAPSSPSAEDDAARLAVEATHRAEWGRLLALLINRTRRLDLAEDALAEAFTRASARWPVDGVPTNPAGWLATTAHRIVLGRLRAEAVAGRHAPVLARRDDTPGDPFDALDELPDDRLQLVLLCCHPALDPAARSALALRLVLGTSTADIARLFLVDTATMAARITRAKRKIVAAGIPLASPVGAELTARLDAVARTVYLAFTAGYAPGSGEALVRADLAGEAVRLGEMLHRLVPGAAQVRALLALMLMQHARRDARAVDGELVTLAEQDRGRWYRDEIDRAARLVDTMEPTHGYAEELRLQALIAREHSVASTPAHTDWRRIAGWYASLEQLTGSPVVRLNRAVAVAEVDGPLAGLAVLDGLDATLGRHHRLHAVRAELARRAGSATVAIDSYRAAIERCANDAERSFLLARLAELAPPD
jgi:RNA polymerase sigma-70 factor (ECF subfamily)